MIRTAGAWTVDHSVNETFPAGMNTVERVNETTFQIVTSKPKREVELLLIISRWLEQRGLV